MHASTTQERGLILALLLAAGLGLLALATLPRGTSPAEDPSAIAWGIP